MLEIRSNSIVFERIWAMYLPWRCREWWYHAPPCWPIGCQARYFFQMMWALTRSSLALSFHLVGGSSGALPSVQGGVEAKHNTYLSAIWQAKEVVVPSNTAQGKLRQERNFWSTWLESLIGEEPWVFEDVSSAWHRRLRGQVLRLATSLLHVVARCWLKRCKYAFSYGGLCLVFANCCSASQQLLTLGLFRINWKINSCKYLKVFSAFFSIQHFVLQY